MCIVLPVSLSLTHRAQRIVGFPHKVLTQPLEYEFGHSLKRERAGPEGAGLEGSFYSGAEFSGDRLCGPREKFQRRGSRQGLKAQDSGSRAARWAGIMQWAEPRGQAPGARAPGPGSENRMSLRGSPRCWLRERWTPPCGV